MNDARQVLPRGRRLVLVDLAVGMVTLGEHEANFILRNASGILETLRRRGANEVQRRLRIARDANSGASFLEFAGRLEYVYIQVRMFEEGVHQGGTCKAAAGDGNSDVACHDVGSNLFQSASQR